MLASGVLVLDSSCTALMPSYRYWVVAPLTVLLLLLPKRVVLEGGDAGGTLLDLGQPIAHVPDVGARTVAGQATVVVVGVVDTVVLRELVVGIEDRIGCGGLRQERFVQGAALSDASSIGVVGIGDVANRGGAVGVADAGQLIGIVIGVGSYDAVGQGRRC